MIIEVYDLFHDGFLGRDGRNGLKWDEFHRDRGKDPVLEALNQEGIMTHAELAKLGASGVKLRRMAEAGEITALGSGIGLESLATERLNQAAVAMQEARGLMAEAGQIKESAERSVLATQSENRVFHSAIEEIVNLWVNDSWKAIADKLTVNNKATQKARMEKVFETCRKYGIDFDGRQERAFYVRLDTEWKREVEAEKARAEQQRIKEIMREEQQAEKMRAAEIKKLEAERKELEKKHVEHLERIRLLREMESLKKITEEQQRELGACPALS
ncbi:MAG: hypothetical protein IT285_09140 [Bdellovibrionales bacterium]|nr:hypothetical protein [Bdellovibrionales bacterium]